MTKHEAEIDLVTAIARALAEHDGCDLSDPDDLREIHALRWSGGSSPEPIGDAWSMDYMPRAELIASRIADQLTAAVMAERERCARVCDAMKPPGGRAWSIEQGVAFSALHDAANAIRQPPAEDGE